MTPKLAHNWKGPYTVVKLINDVVYRIQLGPRTKPRVVHRNRLWKYSGQSPPTWLNATEEETTSASNDETDHSAEGETNWTTTVLGDSPDLEELSHQAQVNNRSHSDKQLDSNAIRKVLADENHLNVTARMLSKQEKEK